MRPGISRSVCVVFNRSFGEYCVPVARQAALVTRSTKVAHSHRFQINAKLHLSIISKVVEKIGYRRLMTFLRPVLTINPDLRKEMYPMQLIRLVQERSSASNSRSLSGHSVLWYSQDFCPCLATQLNALTRIGWRTWKRPSLVSQFPFWSEAV